MSFWCFSSYREEVFGAEVDIEVTTSVFQPKRVVRDGPTFLLQGTYRGGSRCLNLQATSVTVSCLIPTDYIVRSGRPTTHTVMRFATNGPVIENPGYSLPWDCPAVFRKTFFHPPSIQTEPCCTKRRYRSAGQSCVIVSEKRDGVKCTDIGGQLNQATTFSLSNCSGEV